MSDFPSPATWNNSSSSRILKNLSASGIVYSLPIAVHRQKAQYIIDCDGNKYVDFDMDHGRALLGHNTGKMTHAAKNGLSVGTSTHYADRFTGRLVQMMSKLAPGFHISLYTDAFMALRSITADMQITEMKADTAFGRTCLDKAFPGSAALRISNNSRTPVSLSLLEEPVTSDTGSSFVIYYLSSRFFRFQPGNLPGLSGADAVLLDSCFGLSLPTTVVLSRKKTAWYPLPVYLSAAALAGLREMIYREPWKHSWPEVDHPLTENLPGGIFRLRKPVDPLKLLPYGIILTSGTGYLSLSHTEHDIRRLKKALDAVSPA